MIPPNIVNTLSRLRGSLLLHQRATAPKLEHKRPSIEDRKAERELFFWTVRQALLVVVLAALTAYVVVSLVEGRFPSELLLHYPGLPQIPG